MLLGQIVIYEVQMTYLAVVVLTRVHCVNVQTWREDQMFGRSTLKHIHSHTYKQTHTHAHKTPTYTRVHTNIHTLKHTETHTHKTTHTETHTHVSSGSHWGAKTKSYFPLLPVYTSLHV